MKGPVASFFMNINLSLLKIHNDCSTDLTGFKSILLVGFNIILLIKAVFKVTVETK